MKKLILLCLLTCGVMPICSGKCSSLLFTYLDVNSDGSWEATVSYSEFADTLLIISGVDTAMFFFTEQQMYNITNTYIREINVSGDYASTKLSFALDRTEYTAEALRMDQNCDSLEVTLFNDSRPSYHDNNNSVYFGDNFFMPPLTDDCCLELNFPTGNCDFGATGTARLVGGGRSISPYVLQGNVYDSRGLLVKNQWFWHSMFGCMDVCTAYFKTGDDGSYIIDIYNDKKVLNSLTMLFYDRSYPIQLITLGKPFGDTINVDIHMLVPLAEGEDAPDAISVQRSGNTLHVSGAVREIALIDASGRSLSCTRSANVDIKQLPAGIYYLSVQMADGSLFRHPFSK